MLPPQVTARLKTKLVCARQTVSVGGLNCDRHLNCADSKQLVPDLYIATFLLNR